MARKIYYLFNHNGDLLDEFTSLSAAKEAGDEGGHAARWVKQVFRQQEDSPWHTAYYGGSGNSYTIRDYIPENFPETRYSARYRFKRFGTR